MKSQTSFVCSNCGNVFASWYGKCPECGEWKTLREVESLKSKVESKESGRRGRGELFSAAGEPAQFASLKQSPNSKLQSARIVTGFGEVDRVLGGGFVSDEVVLIAGEPGVGKSTLLLGILGKLTESIGQVVYVSSEEEGRQLEHRAERLHVPADKILFSSEKNIDNVLKGLDELISNHASRISGHESRVTSQIKLVVFDSLQGLYTSDHDSLPGSLAQSKEVLMRIVNFTKEKGIVSLVVGHITKEGDIAGPKFLEHMVDCVLFMEGERVTNIRMLRAFKNRFGPTDEVGFFEIKETGIHEVPNPSQYFLDLEHEAVGKASIAVRQGVRIIFATVETLVVTTSLPYPKRVAKGIDSKRLELILAILKKYLRLSVDSYDVYVNVSGGLTVSDTLADLGVAAAIYSSLTGTVLNSRELYVGEVGLLGTVRKTNIFATIQKEAQRLGFVTIHSGASINHISGVKKK
ncbi:MAG: DNA repair protein RadA [Patescibacteria group bacterium]